MNGKSKSWVFLKAVNSISSYELTAVAILRVRSTNLFTSVRRVALAQEYVVILELINLKGKSWYRNQFASTVQNGFEDMAKKSVAYYVQPSCRYFLYPGCSDDALSTVGCLIFL